MTKESIITTLSLFDKNREIRILGENNGQRKIFSGVYANSMDAIDDIQRMEKIPYVRGIYVSLNEVDSDLVSNKILPIYEVQRRVSHDDIVARTWFMIDLDPKKETNLLERAKAIELYLTTKYNWPVPLIAKSGRGMHVLYQTESIPVGETSDSVFRRCLKVISNIYSNDSIDIDEKVFTSSRHAKVYGTIVRKEGVEYQSDVIQSPSGKLLESQILSIAREIKETLVVPVVSDKSKLSQRTITYIASGAPSGQRNQELYIAACDFNGCGLSQEDAFASLIECSGLSSSEVKATIKSAYRNQKLPSAKSSGDWRNLWTSFPYADHPYAYEYDIRKVPETIYMPWKKFVGFTVIKTIGGWICENEESISKPSILGYQCFSSDPKICTTVVEWLESIKARPSIMAINEDGKDILRIR